MAEEEKLQVAIFSTKKYDILHLEPEFQKVNLCPVFLQTRLDDETIPLAKGYQAICIFVNDTLSAKGIQILAESGLKYVLLRCAGFNNVDIVAAHKFNVQVARVPAYSPYAVAEFTIGLMLMLNRNLHKAYTRVRAGNFSLEGLTGFDLYKKRIGIVGTGKIGLLTGKICNGFGCDVVCYDPYPNEKMAAEYNMTYVPLDELLATSDIVSLHCPLLPSTYHMINDESLSKMKTSVMIINTSRGGLIDTIALIKHLKTGKVGQVGMDVYENESGLYFEDTSDDVIQDDTFSRLLTFPNVCITGHQAFLTQEALANIATETANNLTIFLKGEVPKSLVTLALAN
ncbi:D-isomer specific 2-hydroxyacid dehydrogenase [Limtongia smithiae]|uniref:D-isomer specific 2-hydroxyacid dehydrogenase n=1 Tax=Limtongia smithiae TaxID=1125753 RepID=UPI0034CEEB35